jgi:hypothetical protein
MDRFRTAEPEAAPRCCILVQGTRCEEPSTIRIATDPWTGYVYTCTAHVVIVVERMPGCTVGPIPRYS